MGSIQIFQKNKNGCSHPSQNWRNIFLKPIHSDKQHLRDVTRMMVSREV
jgi:hypothetical protein